jgi:hypothetical protein
MANVRPILVAAKLAATTAVQELRTREQQAVKNQRWQDYQDIAAAYDVAKTVEDAATSRLINNLIQAPPGVANQLASATHIMEQQVARMQAGQASLGEFLSAMTAVTSAINLIDLARGGA